MSGVILRCPNCGTGRATPGQCEACHEAQARYFCTNHTPGLWLDGKACGRCGARFGQAAPPPAPVPPPARAPSPRPAAGRPAPPRRPAEEDWGRGAEPVRPREVTLEEILAAAAARARAARPPPRTGMEADPAAATRRVGGCLVRAMFLLFLFVLMMFGGIFMFAGSMFRVF
jgi:hypothetical protein